MPAVKWSLLICCLCSSAAVAQVDADFALPDFAQDAGVPAPSPPPLLPPTPLPGPPPGPPAAARPQKPPPPPPPPSWSPLGGSTSLQFSGFKDVALTGELSLLAALPTTPHHSDEVPGEVEGALFMVGAQGLYGRVSGELCRGTAFCATRVGGGAVFKGGWARGLPSVKTGVARAQTMYFAELDVLLTHFSIESAPLSPGVRTFELLTRLRLGLHFTSDAARVTFTGVTLLLAGVVEVIPVSSGTQGISFGAAAGIGF